MIEYRSVCGASLVWKEVQIRHSKLFRVLEKLFGRKFRFKIDTMIEDIPSV